MSYLLGVLLAVTVSQNFHVLMTLTVLQSTGQVFFRMYFSWVCLMFSHDSTEVCMNLGAEDHRLKCHLYQRRSRMLGINITYQ